MFLKNKKNNKKNEENIEENSEESLDSLFEEYRVMTLLGHLDVLEYEKKQLELPESERKHLDNTYYDNRKYMPDVISSIEIKPNIPFSKFPYLVKKELISKMFFSALIFILDIVLLFINIQMWPISLLFFIFAVVLLTSVYFKAKIFKYKDYVEFKGYIYDIETYGFLKNNKFQLVTVLNDQNKYLNIKIPFSKKIAKGIPINIYLSKNTPILNEEKGPLAKYYLTYSLNNIDEIVPIDSEDMTANDFIER